MKLTVEEDMSRAASHSLPSSWRQGIRNIASFLLVAAAFAVLITKCCISDEVSSTSESGVEQYNKNKEQPSVTNSNKNKNKDKQCSNILLYLEDTFAINGIGCQLNNYVLATIVCPYT